MYSDDYSFDIGPMGAIGEQGSLFLRINRNCPWNRCLFCGTYKGSKFEYRTAEEVKHDIDVIKSLASWVNATSLKLGLGGQVNQEVMQRIVQNNPHIFESLFYDSVVDSRLASLRNVCRWLASGGKNVFLQDADALIMRTPELVEVLKYLKEAFPAIERITSYARSKTCAHKSLEELRELRDAGLSRVLVGIESGCDPVLQLMQKGVTAREHIEAGKKVIEAGIGYVAFVMPGLGSTRWSKEHVPGTVRVLNEIKPHLIRLRSLAIQEDSPLYHLWMSGEFEPPHDDQMVREIRQLVEGLDFSCDIETGQLTNILFEIKGHLPEQKAEIFDIICRYEAMTPGERLKFRLDRYLNNYLPYIQAKGKFDYDLIERIEEATGSLESHAPGAEKMVEETILAIKQRGIP